jgi:hypothetical protein
MAEQYISRGVISSLGLSLRTQMLHVEVSQRPVSERSKRAREYDKDVAHAVPKKTCKGMWYTHSSVCPL